MMGDRGAHTLDAALWALKLGHPTRIEGTSCGANADVHPISAMVTYHAVADVILAHSLIRSLPEVDLAKPAR